MKKAIFTLIVFATGFRVASAQILPTFQLGVKGGVDMTSIIFDNSAFSSNNRAGYLGGVWARFGALGFNFQPEVYLTSKNVDVYNNGSETKAQFTSIDVPLLFGGKIGAFGFGTRFYTGPLVSFAINKDQSFSGALNKFTSLNYQDQNFAWQFGLGLDIKKISIDIRYEAGITKQTYDNDHTRISLFSLALAVPLVKL